MQRTFALVDCNNFYVSCELVFRQAHSYQPVVVLGNNDGCVVARNQAAKALGIAMGTPYFRCRCLLEQHDGLVFSSNYALYQDFSDRVMQVLASFCQRMEVYSIDEAWLDLSFLPPEKVTRYGQQIRAQVLQRTGIAVSIGLASTKTLSKIACYLVKHAPGYRGVLNLADLSEEELDGHLGLIDAQEVWGIGRQTAQALQRRSILTARGLKYADHRWLRHLLNVTVQRAALELRGICCSPVTSKAKRCQDLLTSLSFGRPIERLEELEEAVAFYAARAGEKLRKQRLQASRIGIFIHTNPFERGSAQYAGSAELTLPFPSAFTPELITATKRLLRQIYRPGYRYKKAGVYLSELRPSYVLQPDLFGAFSWEEEARKARLMAVVDLVNEYVGRGALFWGAQGLQRSWEMKRQRLSPRYTTRWPEILRVPTASEYHGP
ncbi:Y-family DNA polymerase [Ktedonosporobacter rubrisoli]|uniref:Y-family DNA polymerase n=1 Tax=Ktedonosporobacter rubrisoli TaxID=2509675 RepID=A0A4P6JKW2_KTERU|nr:Y-family DNA polymerase [Ktedonosporobacter rubrisoli]QBD75640.1 Y-family DNA polymerase [Ktedonosporobacter rubrisoli]